MGDDPSHRSGGGGEELRERVEAGLVAELGSRSVTAGVALFCLLPFLPEVLGGVEKGFPPLRTALVVLWTVVSVRLAAVLVLRLLPRKRVGTMVRKVILLAGSTLVAVGFAVLNVIAIPRLDDTHTALLAVCHAGIGSVALVSMASSLGGFLSYVALNLGSFLFAVALNDSSPVRRLLLALVLLFIASLVAVSVRVNQGLRRSILLAMRLEEAALRDTLTGLRNRRSLADTMTTLSARVVGAWSRTPGSKRSFVRESLSILVLDIDHFKEVNDRHSHAAGDAVLVQFAERLGEQVRREDLAVRWGGEEFVVVAGTGREGDQPVAERIRRSIASKPFRLPNGQMLPVTCSVGHSVFPYSTDRPEDVSWEEVLKVADLALRTAKRKGRDCSVGILCGEGALAAPETAKSLVDGNLDWAEEQGLIQVTFRCDPGRVPA